ncbi:MAG TPA: CopG family transcriptional regulator [Rhizomicrobium sp.]|nr:CopG family transcriptional regulator [Rhizomicrobium sp.]
MDEDLTRRLMALAAKPGMSKAGIISAALRSYLEKEGAGVLDDLLQTRMNRLSGQLDRLERDQRIVVQTLAEFVRHHFLVTAAPPESELASRRAQAEARYQSFIETVGRQLAAGRQPKPPTAALEAAE